MNVKRIINVQIVNRNNTKDLFEDKGVKILNYFNDKCEIEKKIFLKLFLSFLLLGMIIPCIIVIWLLIFSMC